MLIGKHSLRAKSIIGFHWQAGWQSEFCASTQVYICINVSLQCILFSCCRGLPADSWLPTFFSACVFCVSIGSRHTMLYQIRSKHNFVLSIAPPPKSAFLSCLLLCKYLIHLHFTNTMSLPFELSIGDFSWKKVAPKWMDMFTWKNAERNCLACRSVSYRGERGGRVILARKTLLLW